MGKVQFELRALHMPILGWKGSYVVGLVSRNTEIDYFSKSKYRNIGILGGSRKKCIV